MADFAESTTSEASHPNLCSSGSLPTGIFFHNGVGQNKIKNLKLSMPSNVQSWVSQESFKYVLPGQSHDWIMSTNSDYPPPPLGTALKLVAQTNTGEIEVGVMIAP